MMVAYSFKIRFVHSIVSGRKTQTIRAPRKRHARVGEVMQLYTAMRTKQCRPIGVAVCETVDAVTLRFGDGGIGRLGSVEFEGEKRRTTAANLDAFAQRDGFESWSDMSAWWRISHGPGDFTGLVIRWRAFVPSAEALAA